jgi:hypothetical protein
MTPGISGVGLGGLFFIISALLAPIFELIQTIRGRSSLARWQLVVRQAAMAASIVFATTAALWLLELILLRISRDPQVDTDGGLAVQAMEALKWLPLSAAPVLITLTLLVFVLGCTEMLRLVLRQSSSPRVLDPTEFSYEREQTKPQDCGRGASD